MESGLSAGFPVNPGDSDPPELPGEVAFAWTGDKDVPAPRSLVRTDLCDVGRDSRIGWLAYVKDCWHHPTPLRCLFTRLVVRSGRNFERTPGSIAGDRRSIHIGQRPLL